MYSKDIFISATPEIGGMDYIYGCGCFILILIFGGYIPLRSFRRSIFFFVMVFWAGDVLAQSNALTLQETFEQVYRDNPSLQAAREGLKATRELYPQASAGWKPNVNAEASLYSTDINSGNFTNGDGATTKSASINLEQPVFRGFRTAAEMEAAEKDIEAGRAGLWRLEQDIFLQVAQAYIDVLRDRQVLLLEQQNRDLFAREEEAVMARFDAGDVTQTDVKQTQAQHANAMAGEALAQAGLQRSEATFEELTGIIPPHSMEMPVPQFNFPQTRDELATAAATYNPQLSEIRYLHDSARSDIKSSQSTFYPQVTAFASFIKEYDPQPGIIDASDTGTVGVRARINLYEGGANIARTREAKFRANQKMIQIREAERSIKSELVTSWRRIGAYEAEISARELEVTAAKFAAEGVREEARIGERTVLDTLEAEQEVVEAERALIEAKRSHLLSSYMLAAALGRLTADSLGLSAE